MIWDHGGLSSPVWQRGKHMLLKTEGAFFPDSRRANWHDLGMYMKVSDTW